MLSVLLLAGFVTGLDTFAAALALGALGAADRWRRIVAVVGGVCFLVPLAGSHLGREATAVMEVHATLLAAALLGALGLWSVYTALRGADDDARMVRRTTSWGGLLVLGFAVSLDNFVVGFSFGLGGVPPVLLAGTIGVFAILAVLLGLWLGQISRRQWEGRAEIGAGLLFLGLAGATAAGWI